MSVCGQNGQTEDDSGSEEMTATNAVREIYKQKPVSKLVRVLTVLAYLLSVSLAAILLSVYYICVWKSPELLPANHTGVAVPAARAQPTLLPRGSDTTVNEISRPHNSSFGNVTDALTTTDTLPPASDTASTAFPTASTEPDTTSNTTLLDDNTSSDGVT